MIKNLFQMKWFNLVISIFIFLITLQAAAATDNLAVDLRHYYTFDNVDSTPTNLTDKVTTNQLSGTVFGATQGAVGIINQAFGFEGTSKTVNFTNRLVNETNAFSISCWVKTNTSLSTNSYFSQVDSVAANSGGFTLGITNSGGMKFRSFNPGGTDFTSSTTVFAGTMYHVVFVYNTTVQAMYVNGSAAGTAALTEIPVAGTVAKIFGETRNGAGQGWNGTVDECGFWNRTLNTSEISSLYNNGAGLSYSSIVVSASASLSVNLSAPANNTQWNTGMLALNATGNGTYPFYASLYLNGVLNQTLRNLTPVTTSGLIAWYKFDEGIGTVANDSSGFGNTGNNTNATYFSPGKIGSYGLNFTYNSTIVRIPVPNISTQNDFTLSAWINVNNPPDTSGVEGSILVMRYTRGFGFSISSGAIRFTLRNDTTTSTVQSTFQNKTWYLMTGTYNSSANIMNLYLNGMLNGTTTGSKILNSTSTANIGGNLPLTGNGVWFNGSIDDVRIYNRTLSAVEISQLYNNSNLSYNTNISFPVPFSATNQQNFSWYVQLNDLLGNQVNSSTWQFFIDNVNPTITFISPSSLNNSIVFGNLSTLINLTDTNLYSYQYNITYLNGSVLYTINSSNLTGLSSYQINNSFILSRYPGQLLATVRVCDGHTADFIEDFDAIMPALNKGIDFRDNGQDIKISPEKSTDFVSSSVQKESDRYTFSFEASKPETTRTFIVESPEYIDILDGKTEYQGHLITGNKWIDFVTDDLYSQVDVVRLTPNKVQVTVYLTQPTTDWEFHSIGELNCVTQSVSFFSVNSSESYSIQDLAGDSSTFNLNVTYNSSFLTAPTANLIYNGTTTYSGTGTQVGNSYSFVTNFNLPPILSDANVTFYWQVTTNGITYNTSSKQQQIFSPKIDNCTLYTTPVLNLTLRDEQNSSIIFGTASSTVTYSTTNLTQYHSSIAVTGDNKSTFSFCMYPSFASIDTDIITSYTSPGYETRSFIKNQLTATNVTQYFDLYNLLTTASTPITVTLVDGNDRNLPGYTAEVYFHNLGTGNDTLVDSAITDSGGSVVFNLQGTVEGTTQYYSFRFYYPSTNSLALQTTSVRIVGSTARYKLGATSIHYWDVYRGIIYGSHSLIFSNSSNSFIGTWDFTNSQTGNFSINGVCLRVNYLSNQSSASSLYQQNCTTSLSGTYTIAAPSSVSDKYNAILFLNITASPEYPYLLDSAGANYTAELGYEGLFWAVMLLLCIIFAVIGSPVGTIIAAVVGFCFMIITGIISVPAVAIFALIAIGALYLVVIGQ